MYFVVLNVMFCFTVDEMVERVLISPFVYFVYFVYFFGGDVALHRIFIACRISTLNIIKWH